MLWSASSGGTDLDMVEVETRLRIDRAWPSAKKLMAGTCELNGAEATEITSLALPCGDILKDLLRILAGDHRVVQSNVLVFVLIDPGVAQAGILIALEFVNGVVHQAAVEQSQADKQREVGYGQAGNLLEQAGFQLRNHILQRPLSVVGQIHENWNPRGELNELLLNLLPLAVVFLLLFS